jgi:hypothetical protein
MAVVWKKLAYESDCILKSFIAAKGDLISASANDTPAILSVGTNNYVLTADSNEVTGIKWAAPGAPGAHDIFSTSHGDTTGAASPVDGDIIMGNVTPKWSKLAITVPASGLINHLAVANGETRPSWKALFDATVPTTMAPSDSAAAGTAVVAARRDHVHGAPATWAPASHAWSAHSAAVANCALAAYQITDQVIHTVANEAAVAAYATTITKGKILFADSEASLWICTSAA